MALRLDLKNPGLASAFARARLSSFEFEKAGRKQAPAAEKPTGRILQTIEPFPVCPRRVDIHSARNEPRNLIGRSTWVMGI